MSRAEDCEAELQALRRRVAELEERLGAAAPVGADLHDVLKRHERVRLALEGSGIGVYDMDLEAGRGVWSNSAFAILGLTPDPERATQSAWRERVHPDDLERVLADHESAGNANAPWRCTYRIVRADTGEVRWLSAYGRFVRQAGEQLRSIGVAVDVTPQKLAEAELAERQRFIEHIARAIPNMVHVHDLRASRPVWMGGRAEDLIGYTPEEALAQGPGFAVSLLHPEDQPNLGEWRERLARSSDGEVVEFEARLRNREGEYRWVLDRSVVLTRDSKGRAVQTLSAVTDITELRRAAARQALLINELNHRVKNTLATVQSMANQTLRGEAPLGDAADAFMARLFALSAAHDVLTREQWQGASLKELARSVLSPFTPHDPERVRIHGCCVRVRPNVALALSLGLHELCTNAVKYGALSNDAGQVSLRWEARKSAGGRQLQVEWRESGGPLVDPPRRKGLGSRLLTRAVAAELGGSSELQFAPEGVRYCLTAPI